MRRSPQPLPGYWQHVVPQDGDHVVTPGRKGWQCATCGKHIKRVPANEGPEALKSLFRF